MTKYIEFNMDIMLPEGINLIINQRLMIRSMINSELESNEMPDIEGNL